MLHNCHTNQNHYFSWEIFLFQLTVNVFLVCRCCSCFRDGKEHKSCEYHLQPLSLISLHLHICGSFYIVRWLYSYWRICLSLGLYGEKTLRLMRTLKMWRTVSPVLKWNFHYNLCCENKRHLFFIWMMSKLKLATTCFLWIFWSIGVVCMQILKTW